ncbi:MAG TPA: enoyl-ACP reductase [Bryobacteraceae bacterium]|nr:enoyl-ACP reductase [Bryobacteraceae bacterium]
MSQLLEGKTALILGVANRWSLAYAIAQAFQREGARLLLTYQGERLQKTVEELGTTLGAARTIECDVTRDADLTRLAETLQSEDRLDAVVHSIAFANQEDLSRPFVETSREGYLLAHNVSAYSMIAVARAAAPKMGQPKNNPGGAMMTLTYMGSTRVVANYNVMGTAKASLEAAVRYLASDLGPQNIRVNAISAGPVKTAAARGIKDFSKALEAVETRSAMRRNVTPGEVADLAVFLASDLGRGVTGDVLFADAGYHIMGL